MTRTYGVVQVVLRSVLKAGQQPVVGHREHIRGVDSVVQCQRGFREVLNAVLGVPLVTSGLLTLPLTSVG